MGKPRHPSTTPPDAVESTKASHKRKRKTHLVDGMHTPLTTCDSAVANGTHEDEDAATQQKSPSEYPRKSPRSSNQTYPSAADDSTEVSGTEAPEASATDAATDATKKESESSKKECEVPLIPLNVTTGELVDTSDEVSILPLNGAIWIAGIQQWLQDFKAVDTESPVASFNSFFWSVIQAIMNIGIVNRIAIQLKSSIPSLNSLLISIQGSLQESLSGVKPLVVDCCCWEIGPILAGFSVWRSRDLSARLQSLFDERVSVVAERLARLLHSVRDFVTTSKQKMISRESIPSANLVFSFLVEKAGACYGATVEVVSMFKFNHTHIVPSFRKGTKKATAPDHETVLALACDTWVMSHSQPVHVPVREFQATLKSRLQSVLGVYVNQPTTGEH